MAVYPTIKVYLDANNNRTTELDISSRVVSDIYGTTGMKTYTESDRISTPGSLFLTLDNHDDYFTTYPNTNIHLISVHVGSALSVTVSYGEDEQCVFYGYITECKVQSSDLYEKTIELTVLDWMAIASGTSMKNVAMQTNIKSDQFVEDLIEDRIYTQPREMNIQEGTENFPTAYDSAVADTVVFSELNKAVNSELGYMYMNHRVPLFESLVFENAMKRGSTDPLSGYTKPAFIIWDTGSYIKVSPTERLKAAYSVDAIFNGSMKTSDWESGKYVVNKAVIRNNPRTIGTSPSVLYKLGSPISIGSTQTVTMAGGFSNQTSEDVVQGINVITPAHTTDFLFNSLEDGTGTNLTSNIQLTFTYGANGFDISFYNKGAAGFLIFFQVRGTAVTRFDSFDSIAEHTTSQSFLHRTEAIEIINREYASNPTTSIAFAKGIVGYNYQASLLMKSVTFVANQDEDTLRAFMFLDIGSKVRITETKPAVTADYYIQGIDFTLSLDGTILYTWYLKTDFSGRATPFAVWGNSDTDLYRNAIDFGVLDYLSNMRHYSYSSWIKNMGSISGYIISRSIDDTSGRRGNGVVMNNGRIFFNSYKTPYDGHWQTTDIVVPNDSQYHHVVLTYNNMTDNADPLIYVDGVSVAITEIGLPNGQSDDDSDAPLILFSIGPDPTVAGQRYQSTNRDMIIKDVRIYNRILTQAEVTELYNGEDDYTTVNDSGLLFHGIFYPKDYTFDFENDVIPSNGYLLEIAHGKAGVTYNELETDANFMLYGLPL